MPWILSAKKPLVAPRRAVLKGQEPEWATESLESEEEKREQWQWGGE